MIASLSIALFILHLTFRNACYGQVACLSDEGTMVDWYVVYKLPKLKDLNFIQSQASLRWKITNSNIEQLEEQPISLTLNAVLNEHGETTIGGLIYNNRPPSLSGVLSNSTSKGILLFSQINAMNDAFWLVHTVPGFPKTMTEYTWPTQQTANGHMFVCLSMKRSTINLVATQLIYEEPLIYWSQISATYALELPSMQRVINGQENIYRTPFVNIIQFSTTSTLSTAHVSAFGKTSKAKLDTFNKILTPRLRSDIKVWTKTDGTMFTTCSGRIGHVKVVKGPITINGILVTREEDFSKWLITETGQMWCFTTSDYTKSDLKNAGGTVCMESSGLFSIFEDVASRTEICPNTIDEFSNYKIPHGHARPGAGGLQANSPGAQYTQTDYLSKPSLGRPFFNSPKPPRPHTQVYNSYSTGQHAGEFVLGSYEHNSHGQSYYGNNQRNQQYMHGAQFTRII